MIVSPYKPKRIHCHQFMRTASPTASHKITQCFYSLKVEVELWAVLVHEKKELQVNNIFNKMVVAIVSPVCMSVKYVMQLTATECLLVFCQDCYCGSLVCSKLLTRHKKRITATYTDCLITRLLTEPVLLVSTLTCYEYYLGHVP